MNALPRRDLLLIGALALVVGAVAAAQLSTPGYTDAYYYYNAAARLVNGEGLTDAALWTYLGLGTLRGLPVPNHLYWMPLTSLVAAGGMLIGGVNFAAAQLLFVPLYAGLVALAFVVGWQLSGGRAARRTAWLSALIMLGGGFYLPYWFTTASFGPFGLAGAAALYCAGHGRQGGRAVWFAAAGALVGLAWLTRADGLLLLLPVSATALWPMVGLQWRAALWRAAWAIGVCALVMLPWFARNLSVAGSILPGGGLDTVWMRSYDEIANYPPGSDVRALLVAGLPFALQTRTEALVINAQRLLAEQGLIIVLPLALVGWWRRRREPLLSAFTVYAPLLFIAMTFVFTFPGTRGGLFHSGAALMPFWAALGALGVGDAVAVVARWRRWRVGEATVVFSALLALWACGLGLSTLRGRALVWNNAGAYYARLSLPTSAVVMSNDPPALYYFTGLPGVVVPNAPVERIAEIAARFGVTHVVLDVNRTAPLDELWRRQAVPFFLEHLSYDGTFRVYRVGQNDGSQLPQ